MGAMLAEELQNNPNAVYTRCASSMWIRKKSAAKSAAFDVLPAGEGNKERLDRLDSAGGGLRREEIPGGTSSPL